MFQTIWKEKNITLWKTFKKNVMTKIIDEKSMKFVTKKKWFFYWTFNWKSQFVFLINQNFFLFKEFLFSMIILLFVFVLFSFWHRIYVEISNFFFYLFNIIIWIINSFYLIKHCVFTNSFIQKLFYLSFFLIIYYVRKKRLTLSNPFRDVDKILTKKHEISNVFYM